MVINFKLKFMKKLLPFLTLLLFVTEIYGQAKILSKEQMIQDIDGATDENVHGTIPDYEVKAENAMEFAIDLIMKGKK